MFFILVYHITNIRGEKMYVQKSRNENTKSSNIITIVLALTVVITAIAIVGTLYASGTSTAPTGGEHASNSPFSPVINKDNSKPEADPFASLAKKIEANPQVSKKPSQEYTGGY
jgi:flagellar basal body-associated protein FliL